LLNTVFGTLSSGVAPVTSSYESISTVTVGAGGSSSITFSSIPSTYTHLQVRAMSSSSYSGNTPVFMRFNSDTGSNYSVHGLQGNGSTASAYYSVPDVWLYIYRQASPTDLSNAQGVAVTDILDYKDTNKNKTIRSLGGFDANGSGQMWFLSGAWYNTAAISSITISPNVGNFQQYSSFALYGIKGS
jgi:hypothetical protein